MNFLYRPQTQYENLGDALISKNLLDILSTQGNVYIDDRGVPSNYIDIICNKSCLKHVNYNANFALLPFKLRLKGEGVTFVFKPGHFFGNTKSLGGWLRIMFLICYFSCLKVIGVEFMRTGVSIGPLKSGYKFYERFLNKISSFTGVRENKSIEYLTENGISKNIHRVKDLAFWSFNNKRSTQTRRLIAFSFRSFGEGIDDEMVHRISDALKNVYEIYKKKNVKYDFISVTQVQRDVDFNGKIKDQLVKKIGEAAVNDYYYEITKESFETLISLYKDTALIFSNRLHALLFAFESGALPIAMGNEKQNFKVKFVLEDTKLVGNFIDITTDDYSEEKTIDQIMKAISENELNRELEQNFEADDFILVRK
ncbi:TPA: polysaccharide pyruvyl transferase family protein [Raoultella ornithinolytica]|nr:polysaccharide pyruvyl transferase family protein [Raoultella ornithinolytica]